MNINTITTEGRIFASRMAREARRREPISAAALRVDAKTWEEATFGLFNTFHAHFAPALLLGNIIRRITALPGADAGCRLLPQDKDELRLITLKADNHTLDVMMGIESGIIAQVTELSCIRGRPSVAGIVVANISEHVFGRFHDRSKVPPSLADGFDVAFVCAKAGRMIASNKKLMHSEINIPVGDGLIATGSMKVANHQGSNIATAFFDVRTVLTFDMCDEEQLQQLEAIAMAAVGPGAIEDIPVIARRDDFVLQTLAASRGPIN